MITVDVIWYNEDQNSLINVDVPVDDIENADLKEHTFYRIDFIRPYMEKYCEISSGGEIFVANKTYDWIKQHIAIRILMH